MTFSKQVLTFALVFVLGTLVSCGKRDDHMRNSDPDSDATFYVDKDVKIWGKVIVTRDVQQKPNQKDYKIQACIKDNALLAIVQFQDFKVIAADGQEIVKTTDKFGCIIWDEQIRYDALASEAELLVQRKVQAVSGHAGTVVLDLAINPWASEDTLTVTDLRYDEALKAKTTANAVSYSMTQFQSDENHSSPAFSMEVNKSRVAEAIASQKSGKAASTAPETRMRLDAIQMQFLGHDYSQYEITPTLNLKVAHKYRIRISPQFIRENFNGKQIFETIASGNVKFHVAILKDTVNPKAGTSYQLNDVLSTSEFVGEMVDGVMVADVTLKFQDLAPLTGRTILLMTASSLPGYIQFRDGSYISPVGPLVAATSISFVPSNWSAEVIHENNVKYIAQKENRSKTVTNFDYFKQKTGFVDVPRSIDTLVMARSAAPSTAHYAEMMTSLEKNDMKLSQATQNAICSYLTQERVRGVRVCDAKAMDLVNFRMREIVEEITNPVPQREGITLNEDLTINMNYLLSQEQIKGKAQSARAGWNAGLTAGMTAGLNAGLDLDLLNTLQDGQVPGFKLLSWISKMIGNTAPGKPIPIDPKDPNGPSLPGDPVVVPPKNTFGAKLGANLGGNIGGMATYNNDLFTWNLSDSKRETGSITTSVKFAANAEMKVFSFQGKFRKCWIANLSAPLKDQLAKQAGKEFSQLNLPKGVVACLPKISEGKRNEMFVLVNSITGIVNSPLTDSLASSEAPLRLFFRGPMGYSVFKNLIMEKKMEVSFNKFPVEKMISEVQSLKNEGDMFLNQEFPGVLNNVIK